MEAFTVEKVQGEAVPGSGSRNQSNTWARSAQPGGEILFEMFLATGTAASASAGSLPEAQL